MTPHVTERHHASTLGNDRILFRMKAPCRPGRNQEGTERSGQPWLFTAGRRLTARHRQKMLLTWDDKGVEGLIQPRSRSTPEVNVTGWSKNLEVTADGQGIVSHAGLALLRALTDKTGLTRGLSRALATPRLLIHDRGRGPG